MKVGQGASAITIRIRPRLEGTVVSMATWAAQYDESDPADGVYTLTAITADKTESQTITSAAIDTDGIFFVLPAAMFEAAQTTWTASVKFTFGNVINFFNQCVTIQVVRKGAGGIA